MLVNVVARLFETPLPARTDATKARCSDLPPPAAAGPAAATANARDLSVLALGFRKVCRSTAHQ